MAKGGLGVLSLTPLGAPYPLLSPGCQASLLILELKEKAWTQAFPPTPFPCPFPFPELKGGGNMNPTFKALGWGLGNCLWSWVVGSWVFVHVCTRGKLYEEFLLVGALTLFFQNSAELHLLPGHWEVLGTQNFC